MESFSPHRRLRNIGDFSTFPAYAGVSPYDRQSRLRAVLFLGVGYFVPVIPSVFTTIQGDEAVAKGFLDFSDHKVSEACRAVRSGS